MDVGQDELDDGLRDLLLEEQCKLLEAAEGREGVAPLVVVLVLFKSDGEDACEYQLQELALALIDVVLGGLALLLLLGLDLRQGRPELERRCADLGRL